MVKRARPKPRRVTRKARQAGRQPPKSTPPISVGVARRSLAPPTQPNADAVAVFESGVRRLQRRDYTSAARIFRQLLEAFPAERAVLDRTRVYLELCVRELDARPTAPRTLEERLTAATAALNDGNDWAAEQFARAALKEDARHELALYLMAAVEARRGTRDRALSYLEQAVEASPEVRAQARHDADFESLRELDAFHALIEPEEEAALPPLKRRRGARG